MGAVSLTRGGITSGDKVRAKTGRFMKEGRASALPSFFVAPIRYSFPLRVDPASTDGSLEVLAKSFSSGIYLLDLCDREEVLCFFPQE
jgi:hypothetical protein